MSESYQSVKNFIRAQILEPGLSVNSLEKINPAPDQIENEFISLGWRFEDIPGETSKFPKRRIMSPNDRLRLLMRKSLVYRHPESVNAICRSKDLTRQYLENNGVQVPRGQAFDHDEMPRACELIQSASGPFVVKPSDAAGSHGVTLGVETLEQLEKAWNEALTHAREGSKILVEEFVAGMDVRAYVTGDTVVAAAARLQPFVVGDGKSNLVELIKASRQRLKNHAYWKRNPATARWKFLEARGYRKTSVPARDEIVIINPYIVLRYGSSIVDITDIIHPGIKEIAVKAAHSIPELEVAGIDLLVTDINDPTTARVLEVNTAPGPSMHKFATYGKTRDVELDVVAYFHSQFLDTLDPKERRQFESKLARKKRYASLKKKIRGGVSRLRRGRDSHSKRGR
ncbi:hypothetical protein [Auritidibacter ignavus]|uniref:ATP-binding protein n=1 Tax=Auritidibacter ignavus TaxID=678932 RepID=UPI002FE67CFC